MYSMVYLVTKEKTDSLGEKPCGHWCGWCYSCVRWQVGVCVKVGTGPGMPAAGGGAWSPLVTPSLSCYLWAQARPCHRQPWATTLSYHGPPRAAPTTQPQSSPQAQHRTDTQPRSGASWSRRLWCSNESVSLQRRVFATLPGPYHKRNIRKWAKQSGGGKIFMVEDKSFMAPKAKTNND